MKTKDKKRVFWVLMLIFGFWSFLVWSLLWLENTSKAEEQTMMSGSMASMMAGHARNYSLKEILLATQNQALLEEKQSQGNQAGHHGQGILNEVYYLSTVILYLSIPIIIGGSIFLFISWV